MLTVFVMGGNVFSTTRPVHIEELDDLFLDMADRLDHPGLTVRYLRENIYGSTGQKPFSNDVDVVLDEKVFSYSDLDRIAAKAEHLFGPTAVGRFQLNHGQLHIAWPRASGDAHVDLVLGNPEWIRFSCYCDPHSPYKAIFRANTLCALAKRRVSYLLAVDGERIAEVCWAMETRRGLRRQWRLRRKSSLHLNTVDADFWESNLPVHPPRFSRVGLIDDPDAAVGILFRRHVLPDQVQSFEQVWTMLREDSNIDLLSLKREVVASIKNQLRSLYTAEELISLPVWDDIPSPA